MVLRSKRGVWRRWGNRAKPKPNPAPQELKADATKQPEAADRIKKGIYLSALVYIEGEQAAPENFDATATAALKQKLQAALNQEGDLRMTLKKIEVQNDVEEDGGEKEEKFQF